MSRPAVSNRRRVGFAIRWTLVLMLVAACGEDEAPTVPAPKELTRENVGYYCQMIVLDHPGPKGQIFVGVQEQPLWFSSVRDTIAFTRLPEERKDIQAIYVTDMARATDWERPEPGTWALAEDVWYVVGSDARGGMGAPETVPFSDREVATRFAASRGGSVFAWSDIPADAVLGSADADGGNGHEEHGAAGAENPGDTSANHDGHSQEQRR